VLLWNKPEVAGHLPGTAKTVDPVDAGSKGRRCQRSDAGHALQLPELPTAVFVDTDLKAEGAIQAITEAGLRVPEDISILGFDGAPGTDKLTPSLTTIYVPHFEMGQRAAEMVQEVIASGKVFEPQIFNASLLIRDSCAKCKDIL